MTSDERIDRWRQHAALRLGATIVLALFAVTAYLAWRWCR